MNVELVSEIELSKIIYIVSDLNGTSPNVGKLFDKEYIHYRQINIEEVNSNIINTESVFLFCRKNLNATNLIMLEEKLASKNHYCFEYSFNPKCREICAENILQLPLNKKQLFSMLETLKRVMEQEKVINTLESYIQQNEKLLSLGKLTGSIIHDLNNYMTVCKAGYSGITMALDKNLSEAKIRNFNNLGMKGVNEVIKISQRCDSFLKSSESTEQETFHLYELCEWLLNILKDELRENRIEFRIQINKSVVIKSDRSVILQALLNLLKNSVNAIKSNTGLRWIEISFKNNGEKSSIYVKDSGSIEIGRPQDIFRIDYTTDHATGHGVGLYFVKVALEPLGINIEQIHCANTTFLLSLPKNIITYGM